MNANAPDLSALLATAEQNLRALELFSRYLNLCPRYVSSKDVRALTEGCGVSDETAYRLLVEAACGLNPDENKNDRVLSNGYFRLAIHRMDAAASRADPYYQTVRMPARTLGTWRMGYKTLEAYEAFTADDLLLLPDGREVPQIGYFTEAFRAPVVEQNGREWMTVTPSEIRTMTADIRAAHGRVAVFGLGLGYYAFMISMKPEVEAVTVIERDPEVIALFREHLLEQFPGRAKIEVAEADAYLFAAEMGARRFDVAYVDIWHDVLDGTEMYLRMKRLESASPQTRFLYWIEPSILAWLRSMALLEVSQNERGPMLQTIGPLSGVAALREALSDESLRRIAHKIPLEVAQQAFHSPSP